MNAKKVSRKVYKERNADRTVKVLTAVYDCEDHSGDPRYAKRGKSKLFKS